MSRIKELTLNDQKQSSTALSNDVDDELAAFGAAANQNLRSKFFGMLLTYKKEIGAPKGGRFRFGENKIELPLGTRLIPIMSEARHGYRAWRGGKIAGKAIYKVVETPFLNRNILGDLNEDAWPISELTGKREDPWLHYTFLPLVTLDGRTFYTFSAKSYYGREAFYDLGDRYRTQGRQHPGQWPIIELASEIRKSKKFGEIPAPTFPIVGWTSKPTLALEDHREQEAEKAEITNPAANETVVEDVKEIDNEEFRPRRDDDDDGEIPF